MGNSFETARQKEQIALQSVRSRYPKMLVGFVMHYFVIAHDEHDFLSKRSKIVRGDIRGFLTLESELKRLGIPKHENAV